MDSLDVIDSGLEGGKGGYHLDMDQVAAVEDATRRGLLHPQSILLSIAFLKRRIARLEREKGLKVLQAVRHEHLVSYFAQVSGWADCPHCAGSVLGVLGRDGEQDTVYQCFRCMKLYGDYDDHGGDELPTGYNSDVIPCKYEDKVEQDAHYYAIHRYFQRQFMACLGMAWRCWL